MFMVMASEGAELGAAAKTSGLAVVGLLASQYAWKEFDAQCHALDCQASDLTRCAKILESTGVVAIAAAAGAPSSSVQTRFPTRTSGLDPARACFEYCLLEAARRMQPAPLGQTLCLVMDWHDPLAPSALWHLEELINLSPLSVRERLGAMGFEHRDAFLPLRAAGWLATRCLELKEHPKASGDLPWLDCTFIHGSSSNQSIESI